MGIVSYRARHASGEEVRGRLDAPSLEDARALLIKRGLTEIELLSDPIFPDADGMGPEGRLTPPRRSMASFVAISFCLWAVVGAFTWWAATHGRPAVLVALVPTLAAIVWLLGIIPIPVFRAMQDAKARGRWSLVRRQLAFLRFVSRFRQRRRALTLGFDQVEAETLAATGHLEEAITLMRRHEGETQESRAFHHTVLAMLYWTAGRYEDARDHQRASAELCPHVAVYWVSLALTEASLHEPAAARATLGRAEGLPRSAVAELLDPLVLSLLAMEEGDPAAALAHAVAAWRKLLTTPVQQTSPDFRAFVEAVHACALAINGKPAEARALLDAACPFLVGEPRIVQRAEEAISRAGNAGVTDQRRR